MENTVDFPLVTIITVNYNQEHVTRDLLHSIQELNYPNYEVIIVDNGSKTSLSLNGQFSQYKLIRSEENLGFAGGNNLGIIQAKGSYLFFVNNDTILPQDCIEPLIRRFSLEKNAGVVSPKIKYYDDPTLIQYAGYTPMNPFTARNKGIGYQEVDKGQYDKTIETSFAHGAAMMVKREVVDRIGLMPEVFFLYYEEFDWCEQIRKGGYKIYYEPKSVIYHKESISVGKNSPMKTYYMIRNRILFMRRNSPKIKLSFFYLYLCMIVVPKELCIHLLNKESEHIKAFFRGFFWNFRKVKT